jgi:hypothetical protein
MKRKAFLYLLLLVILLMVACSGISGDAELSESTRMAVGIQQTQNAFIQETLSAATAQIVTPTMQPPATVDAPATQAVETANAEALQASQSTVEPVLEVSATVEPGSDGDFSKIDAYVRAEDATYFKLDPVNQTWMDKDNYWESLSSQEAGDFVLSTKVYWTSPQDMTDPARYGCGFIYGKSDPKHYHVTYISPDQKVHTFRKRAGEEIEMKGGSVPGGGLGVSSGSAEMVMVVEDKVMTTYINGIQVVMFNDPYINFGGMGLAIATGSYSGFTCSFEDVELWILK